MIKRNSYKRQVGVFSGSFNPIHVAHLMLANYITEFTYIDEVWFVVTPHNPLKPVIDLADEEHRLQMCQIALKNMDKLKISEIEFSMPKPSYTINTLEKLRKDYPDFEFTLIIGADNWNEFHLWREYERLQQEFKILIYPRLGQDVNIEPLYKENVQLCNAPILEVSSTFVRKSICEGKDMRAFLPNGIWEYILENDLYDEL